MKRILLVIALTFTLVGLAKAQEATGQTAEKVKKEILQLEEEKCKVYMSTTGSSPDGSYAADWVARIDADDIAFIGVNGRPRTKAEHIAGFRSGKTKVYLCIEHNPHVRIYGGGGDGTTAVVTYLHEVNDEHDGQRSTTKANGTDVFVKVDGAWRWVVHSHSRIPEPSQ
jgi:hypothetical protein